MKTRILVLAAICGFLATLAFAKAAQNAKPTVFVAGTGPGAGSTATDTTRQLVKACPGLIITLDRRKADYTVVRDIGPGTHPQKLTVFDSQRQLIYTGQTWTVKGAANDACKAIRANLEQGRNHK